MSSSVIFAFIDRLELGQLVPDDYARYRPAVREAVLLFLRRLPDARVTTILQKQARLPAAATAEDRLLVLLSECPTLHKLGQVIARDRRLSPELRRRLQRLESLPSSFPMAEASALLRTELETAGRDSHPDLDLGHAPLAEGSVAMVLPFEWQGHGRRRPARGVLKLLKPHVEERLEEELAIWSDLGDLLDRECERLDLPAVDYRDTFDAVTRLLMHEIHFEHEQRNLAEAGHLYSREKGIQIPELLPFSTPRLTAMSRIEGVLVTELPRRSLARRHLLARQIAEGLVASPVFDASAQALFHADPHAGNLMATRDGRLGIVDWSLVGRLDKASRRHIAQILLGALRFDRRRIARGLAGLSDRPADPQQLLSAVDRSLRRLRRGALLGTSWLVKLLDEAALSGAVRYPPDLLLFRKALLTLLGVLADVGHPLWLDSVLIGRALRQLTGELPRRLLTSPFSHDFASHVSNADLLSLAVSGPAAAANFWRGTLRDLLDRRR